MNSLIESRTENTKKKRIVQLVWGSQPELPPDPYLIPLRLDLFPEPRELSFQKWFQSGTNLQYLYSIQFSDHPEVKKFFQIALDIMIRVDAGFSNYDDGFLGLKNTFLNKELILTRGDISRAKCTYQSAILIAAGPSMNDCWDKISNECLIVVCDVMYKKCLEKGITPHIVVSTERISMAHELFKDAPHKTLLVTPFVADPRGLAAWTGDHNFVCRKDYPGRWYPLKKRKTIEPHASVVPTMVEMCGLLGIKNILLLGQDLSFQDGTSHADMGDSLKKEKLEIETFESTQIKTLVECHDGHTRTSTPTWTTMREAIYDAGKSWNLSLSTAAPTGAKIRDVPCTDPLIWYERNPLGGEFKYQSLNRFEEEDREAWDEKAVKALQFFQRVAKNIYAHDTYGLLFDPNMHLLTAILLKGYVIYLHERFQAADQMEAMEAKQKLIKIVLKAIREVGALL